MKSSIFDNLDSLIEQAVADSTERELKLQKRQEKIVKSSGLEKKKDKKESDVEEADDDEDKKDSPEKEEPKKEKKITGKPKKSDDSDKSSKTPGTKTSKKLDDPSPETIRNPNYPDFEKKINALRGGSSLRKKPIASSVKEYIQALEPAERAAFLTYLTDLAQIMAPVKTAKDVKDLDDIGIQITFKPGAVGKERKEDKKQSKPSKPKKDDVIVVGDV